MDEQGQISDSRHHIQLEAAAGHHGGEAQDRAEHRDTHHEAGAQAQAGTGAVEDDIRKMKTCRKCKRVIPDDAIFCPYCGIKQSTDKARHRRGNGLGTVYKRGNTWTAAVVVGWKTLDATPEKPPHRVPVKRYKGGFATKREALEFIPQLRAGKAPIEAPKLMSYWETYEAGKFKKLSASKQVAYRGAWGKLKDLHWLPVNQISVADLQRVVASAAPTHYTAKDCKTVLQKLFEMAAAEGWCSKDLPAFIELPQLKEKVRETFSDVEQGALWKLYEGGDLRAAIPLLMICTGMMPGEMQALKVEHIDIDARKITGVGMKTKVRRESAIYLPEDILPVVEDLIQHAAPSGYIWPHNEDKWYAAYYAALEVAGCRRLEPYCCRHTTATRLAISEGVAPQTVKRMMRWSTAKMLDRYAHPDDSDVLAAADKLKKIKPDKG